MLEKILGMLMGKAGKGAQGSLMAALLPMLIGGAGGGLDLGSILGKLQSSGAGDKVDSWLSQETNKPLSAREVRKAIDPGQLEVLARGAGLSKRQTADGLGKLLPDMVDKLSPNGSLLDGDDLAGGVGGLKAAMGL